MNHLSQFTPGKRKNILSAVVAVTSNENALAQYRKQMIEDINSFNADQKQQTMTDKQKENWISQKDMVALFRQTEKDVQPLWNKTDLTQIEIQRLMKFVVLACYVLIPPRRLQDYIYFKVRNVDTERDNYVSGRSFVFNKYKTSKTYGQQRVQIPTKLHSIVLRWTKKGLSDYLVFNSKGLQLTQPQLTILLNSIFGKKFSVNGLRHTFITDKVLANTPALTKLEQTAADMGHSVGTQQLYRKLG